MSDLAISSGALSTDSAVRSEMGKLSYASAGSVAIAIYDGTSSTGLLIDTLAATQRISYDTPVKFGTGLFVTVASTTGIAVVHTA